MPDGGMPFNHRMRPEKAHILDMIGWQGIALGIIDRTMMSFALTRLCRAAIALASLIVATMLLAPANAWGCFSYWGGLASQRPT